MGRGEREMIEITYKVKCNSCGREYEQKGFISNEYTTAFKHPLRWVRINNDWYCPDHEITVKGSDGGWVKYNSATKCGE